MNPFVKKVFLEPLATVVAMCLCIFLVDKFFYTPDTVWTYLVYGGTFYLACILGRWHKWRSGGWGK